MNQAAPIISALALLLIAWAALTAAYHYNPVNTPATRWYDCIEQAAGNRAQWVECRDAHAADTGK